MTNNTSAEFHPSSSSLKEGLVAARRRVFHGSAASFGAVLRPLYQNAAADQPPVDRVGAEQPPVNAMPLGNTIMNNAMAPEQRPLSEEEQRLADARRMVEEAHHEPTA